MEFVIGGAAQGKLKITLERTGLSENDVCYLENSEMKNAFNKRIFYGFQDYIKANMQKGFTELQNDLEEFLIENSDAVIICDEVGSGIVPANKSEREYREMVGRVGCIIAEKAKRVYRVFCGVSTRIK